MLVRDQRGRVGGGDVHDDVACSIEPTGLVALELARCPAVRGPRLPHERWIPRIDADALDVAVKAERNSAARDCVRESEQEFVAGLRCVGEAEEAFAALQD